MIRTAWSHDLPALRELFALANDAPYDLAEVTEEKCFGLGIDGQPVVRAYDIGERIVGAAVLCGRFMRVLAVARDARRRGIGSALVADAEEHGVSIIAAEPGNYFIPGVSMEDAGIRAFFHARGYIETRWTWNLDVALARLPAGSGVVRPSHEDADRALDFIEREFGRIWRFEARKAFEREVPMMFVAEEDGEIVGFAAHDVNNRGLAFFGPTGVSKAMRGKGIGCRLLLASLSDLHRLGYERAVIPWTDALDFYRKCCGATPAHRFIAFARKQES
jgi:predicted N-acetyltransferase YhbS